jgi:uncharacterized protein (TIGR00290 family)
MTKVILSWSSGKDSAWALHTLRQDPAIEVAGLVTTVNQVHQRVAMHAVRLELLEEQAAACGLPLHKILIPHPCSNQDYERAMGDFFAQAKKWSISKMAFGDLFLEDIRQYRERQLAGTGLEPLFPIWGLPTGELAREMVRNGLRAYVTCVDPKQLRAEFAGRLFDDQFLDDLPVSVDPCGEKGEFHTFALSGPMFTRTIPVIPGEIVEREGFIFADLKRSERRL